MRWEGDTRGEGVGDGRKLVDGATELVTALGRERWVAEEPEAHLLPHLRAWCEQDDRLALEHAESDAGGSFHVSLRWQGDPRDQGGIRAAVFGLLGSFAETATYVRQRGADDGAISFEVATGLLPSDTRFDTHGHVIVLTFVRD